MSKNLMIQDHKIYKTILKQLSLADNDVIACYPFGSRVYRTATEKSDYDYIVVVDDLKGYNNYRCSNNNINLNVFSKSHFEELLNRHKMSLLECIFLPKTKIIKNYDFNFSIDNNKLIKYSVEKCKDDWKRAEKYFQYDFNQCIKSIFHALRTLDFANQIKNDGCIKDYSKINFYFHNLVDMLVYNEFDNLALERYKNIFNRKLQVLLCE